MALTQLFRFSCNADERGVRSHDDRSAFLKGIGHKGPRPRTPWSLDTS